MNFQFSAIGAPRKLIKNKYNSPNIQMKNQSPKRKITCGSDLCFLKFAQKILKK